MSSQSRRQQPEVVRTPVSGVVRKWDDDRGYGFIRPAAGGADVFLHVTDVRGRRRPHTGDRIRYRTVREDGRARAVDARIRTVAPSAVGLAAAGSVAIAAGLVAAWYVEALAVPLPIVAYAVMTIVTFVAYWDDKRRAENGRWRTPEATLHFFELACGWLGALVGQHYFRHKRRKTSYQVVFWAIGLLHLSFWAWWLAGRPGLAS